jgi:hypothetical protein
MLWKWRDHLDAAKLLCMLLRHAQLREKVWSVVHVPTPAEEDAQQLHREVMTQPPWDPRPQARCPGLPVAACQCVSKLAASIWTTPTTARNLLPDLDTSGTVDWKIGGAQYKWYRGHSVT